MSKKNRSQNFIDNTNLNEETDNIVNELAVEVTNNEEEPSMAIETLTSEELVQTLEETPVVVPTPVVVKTIQDYIEDVKKLNLPIVEECISALIEYSKTMNEKMAVTESAGGSQQESLLASFKKLVIYSGEHFKFVFSVFLMIIEDDLRKYGEQSAFSDSKKLRFLDKTTFDVKGKTTFKFLMNFLSDSCFVKDRSTVNVRINFEHLKPIFTKNFKEEKAEQFVNQIKHFFI